MSLRLSIPLPLGWPLASLCPAWSHTGALARRLRNPLTVLVAATLAAAACAAYLHPRAGLIAAGLATAVVLGLAWPWVGARGLAGTLRFERGRAREGDPVGVRLEVRNRLPWAAWGVALRGAVVEGARDTTVGLACAPGWRTTEARWELVPARRGVYPEGPPRLTTGFPFGLREFGRPLDCPARLVVWPRTVPVGPVPESAAGREGDGQAQRPRPGNWGDPLGLRAYRRGDPLKRIHWPQTARHGELIVCEAHAAAAPVVQVVLDADPGAFPDLGPEGSREWTIRVAASLAEGWIGQGAEVELVAGRVVVPSRHGTARARAARVLDALAALDDPDARPLGEVLAALPVRVAPGGLRVVVASSLSLVRHAPVPRGRSGWDVRFVVLDAPAIDGRGPTDPASLAVRPWIWLDDPRRVAAALDGRNLREVAHA